MMTEARSFGLESAGAALRVGYCHKILSASQRLLASWFPEVALGFFLREAFCGPLPLAREGIILGAGLTPMSCPSERQRF